MKNKISGWIAGIGFVVYISLILSGSVQPAIGSWVVYSLLNATLLYGMAKSLHGNSHIKWMTAGAFAVLGLSLRYGIHKWDRVNLWCVAGGVIGLMLVIFARPWIGVLVTAAVVMAGSVPTFRSAYENPLRESVACWTLFWLSSLIATLNLPWGAWGQYSWQERIQKSAQPLAFLANQSITLIILILRR